MTIHSRSQLGVACFSISRYSSTFEPGMGIMVAEIRLSALNSGSGNFGVWASLGSARLPRIGSLSLTTFSSQALRASRLWTLTKCRPPAHQYRPRKITASQRLLPMYVYSLYGWSTLSSLTRTLRLRAQDPVQLSHDQSTSIVLIIQTKPHVGCKSMNYAAGLPSSIRFFACKASRGSKNSRVFLDLRQNICLSRIQRN